MARNRNRKPSQNNFQDRAEIAEFKKGFKKGKEFDKKALSDKINAKMRGNVSVFTGSSDNDYSWYVPNNQLAKDFASIPFGTPTGLPMDNGFENNPLDVNGYSASMMSVPGIMTFKVSPTIGNSLYTTDPINVSSAALFAYVRHMTSGQSYYEAPDLSLYILAAANLYSFYTVLTRVYGSMSDYSVLNRFSPRAMVTAMGFDFDSIQKNLSDFRAFINTFAYKLQQLFVPLNIKYIARLIFLFENIYMDSRNSKAQYYMYVPGGFWQYQEGSGSAAAGQLNFKRMTGTASGGLMIYDDIIKYANALLEPIIGSQDCLYISADLLKAFGPNGGFQVNPIAEDFTVSPVYNSEVLSQMENAFILGVSLGGTSTITQTTAINQSCLVSNYKFSGLNSEAFNALVKDRQYVNMHGDSPSPEEMVVALQFANVGPTTDASGNIQVPVMGSAIVENAFIYYYEISGDKMILRNQSLQTNLIYDATSDVSGLDYIFNFQQYMDVLALLSNFDWHPTVRLVIKSELNAGQVRYTVSRDFHELDNYTPVMKEVIDNIYMMSFLGLFPGKDLGTFSLK